MEANGLANWKTSEREVLARRLRTAVKASTGAEELLWNELLLRLEKSLEPMKPEDAARVMLLDKHPHRDVAVNQIAHKLREKVQAASETLTPTPHAYLSRRTYAIQVEGNPPPGWKQDIGPSIGLLLADATDEFVGRLILGITEVCNRHNYDLVVDVSADDPITETKKIERLFGRTHGVLIVPASNSLLAPSVGQILRNHDCVFIDRYLRDLPDVPCVHPDDISAGRQAGLFLKECGCSRVLIVDQASRSANDFAITPLEDRVKGCKIQLQNQLTIRHLPAMGSDEEGGFCALEQFDQRHHLSSSDGIFALTDRIAVGCKHYLATRKLDLPVIGTEGKSFGDFMTPPLVSIQFDDHEMGRLAARVLFTKLQKEKDPPSSECAPHYLLPPVLLRPSKSSGKRERFPVEFPDAASYYSTGRK